MSDRSNRKSSSRTPGYGLNSMTYDMSGNQAAASPTNQTPGNDFMPYSMRSQMVGSPMPTNQTIGFGEHSMAYAIPKSQMAGSQKPTSQTPGYGRPRKQRVARQNPKSKQNMNIMGRVEKLRPTKGKNPKHGRRTFGSSARKNFGSRAASPRSPRTAHSPGTSRSPRAPRSRASKAYSRRPGALDGRMNHALRRAGAIRHDMRQKRRPRISERNFHILSDQMTGIIKTVIKYFAYRMKERQMKRVSKEMAMTFLGLTAGDQAIVERALKLPRKVSRKSPNPKHRKLKIPHGLAARVGSMSGSTSMRSGFSPSSGSNSFSGTPNTSRTSMVKRARSKSINSTPASKNPNQMIMSRSEIYPITSRVSLKKPSLTSPRSPMLNGSRISMRQSSRKSMKQNPEKKDSMKPKPRMKKQNLKKRRAKGSSSRNSNKENSKRSKQGKSRGLRKQNSMGSRTSIRQISKNSMSKNSRKSMKQSSRVGSMNQMISNVTMREGSNPSVNSLQRRSPRF